MSTINVSYDQMPLIEFESEKWENNDYSEDLKEIIDIIKNTKFTFYLLRNNSYMFGDTETHPIIMIHRDDYGGFNGTLETYIEDIIIDLIPEDEDLDE